MVWWCRLTTRRSCVTSDAGSKVKDIFIIPHRQLVGQPTAKRQEEINNKIKYIPNTNDKIHRLTSWHSVSAARSRMCRPAPARAEVVVVKTFYPHSYLFNHTCVLRPVSAPMHDQ